MFLLILLLFIVLPILELAVLIRVGEVLGTWPTVGLVILTAIVGISLVRSQGIHTLMQVQKKLSNGEAPGQEIVEGMMLGLAGLLLVVPGFITDFIGILLLTRFIRIPVAGFLYKRMQLKVVANGRGSMEGRQQSPFGGASQGQTFDGDFEKRPDPSDKRPESHQVEADDKVAPHSNDDPKKPSE
ncbi:FxsA family protein [uncultured Shewanella sp.]|uniref:FxsA family protein n=1 Tax=uncultured Shewanella sp. TaxID=173975 RepID=UPI00262C684B|nr:FxsA family protein [uncultured Shewanella sp.]